jgi:hypothetical protein
VKGLYEDLIAVFLVIAITSMFYSCISPTQTVPATPTSTPTSSPKPTLTPSSFAVSMPASVSQGEKFRVSVPGAEDTWMSIWVDKKYPQGDMRFDKATKLKYLDVKLDTRGTREIDFRVNNLWVYSKTIEVTK